VAAQHLIAFKFLAAGDLQRQGFFFKGPIETAVPGGAEAVLASLYRPYRASRGGTPTAPHAVIPQSLSRLKRGILLRSPIAAQYSGSQLEGEEPYEHNQQ
jgi:hypothetical protein